MDKKREIIGFCTLVLLIIVLFAVFQIPCIITFLTGCSCPGCGMTRAYISLLRLDFKGAFYYHPLWPFVPVFGLGFLVSYIKKLDRLMSVLVALAAVLLVAVYVYRLVWGQGEVVSWNFEKGLVYRVYSYIRNIFNSFQGE